VSKFAVTIDDQVYRIELDLSTQDGSEVTVKVDGQPVRVLLPDWNVPVEQMEWLVVDDKPYELVFDRDLQWIRSHSRLHRLAVRDLEARVTRPRGGDGRVKAPIPGQITQVLVSPGEPVRTGQALLLLEAMKMENEIRAPCSGTLNALHVTPGQSVSLHEVLAEIT
jgi:biotin carboxyl carrier protein